MSSDDVESKSYDFDESFQLQTVTLFMRDTNFALKSKELIKPEYFTNDAIAAVYSVISEHIAIYKSVPDVKILPTLFKEAIDKRKIRSDLLSDIKSVLKSCLSTVGLSSSSFVFDKVKDFARQRAVEEAMLKSIPLLESGKFDDIAKNMKQALAIGSNTESQDYDYWKEIESRTQKREDFNAGKIVTRGITTGYSGIDQYLYHAGWGRKELSCLMGAAKAGKSLGLGDFTKNASLAGYNTFYGSCEVAASIIAERLDAAISDIAIKDLKINPSLVRGKIKAMEAKAGAFKMRDFASGTLKPSQLYRVIDDYKSDGIIMDLITVDYADIMASEYRSDRLIDNLREIYIDLRAIAHEFDAALLTATQTNRDGAKAVTAKATDVGDDWNKARTVDILLGINASDAEKAAGEARIYWALSRNTEDGFSLRIRQDRQKMQFITKILGRE